jgi:hypothetical protein
LQGLNTALATVLYFTLKTKKMNLKHITALSLIIAIVLISIMPAVIEILRSKLKKTNEIV